MLTSSQLTFLRQDLRGLAHIEYDDVENELLDHYATLTEQKLADGQTFQQASAYAWEELGSGPGLLKIQEDYVKNIRKQISTRHLEIMKSYFRWPAIVGTLLICGLMYQLSSLLAPKTIYIIVVLLLFGPSLVLLYAAIRKQNRHNDSRKLAWQYMNSRASIPMAILQGTNGFGMLLRDDAKMSGLLLDHPVVMVGLGCIALVYALTFLQLYRERFYYKVA
jgi:hypothetical protein